MAIPPTMDNTIGAFLVAVVFSSMLFGVSSMQAWHYFVTYPKDTLILRALVILVIVSDTVHMVFCVASLYDYVVTHFGDAAHIAHLNSAIVYEVLFSGITGFMVQMFFAHRIYRFSNNPILTGAVVALIIASLAVAIGFTITTLPLALYSDIAAPWVATHNGSMATTDLIIGLVMAYLLASNRTEYATTKSIVDKLILMSVNTGLITAFFAVMTVITYYSIPNTFIFLNFYVQINRLYCNSLLATLNARNYIKSKVAGASYQLQARSGSGRDRETAIAVNIETVKEVTQNSRASLEFPDTKS